MRKIITIASVVFLLVNSECQAQETKNAEKAAISAAEEWLALVDGENYGESWDEAAGIFKAAITRDRWIQVIQSSRKPMGKVLERELKSSTYYTSLPGAPDGEYVVIQFSTSFENNTSATETITPALDKDGQWRTSGYYIK